MNLGGWGAVGGENGQGNGEMQALKKNKQMSKSHRRFLKLFFGIGVLNS